MKKFISYLVFSAAIALSTSAYAENLDNDVVISLVELGLGDEAIIAKIKSSNADFETDVDDLIALKNKGVSSAVIAAMIDNGANTKNKVVMQPNSPDPNLPHPEGFYYLSDWDGDEKMKKIDFALSDQSKSGSTFTDGSGLFSAGVKVYLAGTASDSEIRNNKPVFYMFLNESNKTNQSQNGVWSSANLNSVQSPDQLTLVRFKSKKDKREVKVGKIKWGVVRGGISDKHKITFDTEEVRSGVFKLTPSTALENGEYGFILPLNGTNNGGVANSRFFDFTINN